MALSKPQKINRIVSDNSEVSIPIDTIMQVCKVEYSKAISVEIIHHLLGSEDLEYNSVMELENSFDCYTACKRHLLELVQKNKRQILKFEDRQDKASNILIIVEKQEATKWKRQHVIFNAVFRLTLLDMIPNVGFAKYMTVTGTKLLDSDFINKS